MIRDPMDTLPKRPRRRRRSHEEQCELLWSRLVTLCDEYFLERDPSHRVKDGDFSGLLVKRTRFSEPELRGELVWFRPAVGPLDTCTDVTQDLQVYRDGRYYGFAMIAYKGVLVAILIDENVTGFTEGDEFVIDNSPSADPMDVIGD